MLGLPGLGTASIDSPDPHGLASGHPLGGLGCAVLLASMRTRPARSSAGTAEPSSPPCAPPAAPQIRPARSSVASAEAHSAKSAAGGRFAAPAIYTPKHLAERILTSKAALEGERKQVTVLFADLKGSMELLADRDPEEARKLLDPVLERMMEAVHRYEGTVNQVMGDGIMALFGAPRGPRGSRRPGLLRRAPDARVGEAVCGRDPAHRWLAHLHPRRPELG